MEKDIIDYELKWLNSGTKITNIRTQIPNENVRAEVTAFLKHINTDFNFMSSKEINRVNNHQFEALYYKGNKELLNARNIFSIIGTRRPSLEGMKKTIELVTDLAKTLNPVFVSGLALGIDTYAMKTAFNCNSSFIGVIGTPIDNYYPYENKDYQMYIAEKHLLLSHVPFYKYSKQSFNYRKGYFVERNHVMANISDASIIIEAHENSGTFHQAKSCLASNRKVFIHDLNYDKSYKWVDDLTNLGAIRIKNINDIIDNL